MDPSSQCKVDSLGLRSYQSIFLSMSRPERPRPSFGSMIESSTSTLRLSRSKARANALMSRPMPLSMILSRSRRSFAWYFTHFRLYPITSYVIAILYFVLRLPRADALAGLVSRSKLNSASASAAAQKLVYYCTFLLSRAMHVMTRRSTHFFFFSPLRSFTPARFPSPCPDS